MHKLRSYRSDPKKMEKATEMKEQSESVFNVLFLFPHPTWIQFF